MRDWDLARRLDATTLPSSRVVDWTYDSAGRPTGASDPDGVTAISTTRVTPCAPRRCRATPREPRPPRRCELSLRRRPAHRHGVRRPRRRHLRLRLRHGRRAHGHDAHQRPRHARDAAHARSGRAADRDRSVRRRARRARGRRECAHRRGAGARATAYDGTGRQTRRTTAGRRRAAVDTSQIAYDSADRVTSRTETVGAGAQHATAYGYDQRGRLTTRQPRRRRGGGDLRVGRQRQPHEGERRGRAPTTPRTACSSATAIDYDFDADGFMTGRGDDTFRYSARGELLEADGRRRDRPLRLRRDGPPGRAHPGRRRHAPTCTGTRRNRPR